MLKVELGVFWVDLNAVIVFFAYPLVCCIHEGTRFLEALKCIAILLGAGELTGVTLIGGKGLIGGQVGSLFKSGPRPLSDISA